MTRAHFGTTRDGRAVEVVTLDNGDLSARILTLGATLQDLRLAGLDRGLTLGSDRLEDYEDGGALHYFGCIVGPVANRIRDARTEFDGRELRFEANGGGGHALHGGAAGLHHKIWEIDLLEEARVILSTHSPDGEGGFPGNRRYEAEFALDGASLTLKLRATTDAPTLMNLANHSYWNLGDGDDIHGHRLRIDAARYLPSDENGLVTGAILEVENTPFDFRDGRTLSEADTLDNNFCLSDDRRPLTTAGRLTGPDNVRLDVETTEPGLQFYDARHLSPSGVPGHDGRLYRPRGGLAIEAQFWPDAPNNPGFPSIRLDPGRAWEQVTRFTVSRV